MKRLELLQEEGRIRVNWPNHDINPNFSDEQYPNNYPTPSKAHIPKVPHKYLYILHQ